MGTATVLVGMIAVLALAAGNAHAGDQQPTIQGTVYADLNHDGHQGDGEGGLIGWTVYADLDANAIQDPSEPSAETGVAGVYILEIPWQAAYQPFQVREQIESGWSCITPAPDCMQSEQPYFEPSERAVQTLARTGRDFGNAQPVPAEPAAVGATQAPGSGIAGKQVSSGTARLSSAKGCTSRRARVSVRGKGIANVSYYVDSRKQWTVVSPDAKGRFNYEIKTSKLKAGVHRVRAQVTFVAVSATASKTLTATIQRCATRATPKFTG